MPSCLALSINLKNEANQLQIIYIITIQITFSPVSVGTNSWKGNEGLLGFPITSVNNLETIPTTATSAKPVISAIGKIVKNDFLLFGDKHLRRR